MLTGQEYKDSLKDGRKVYFQGEQIDDLESVPALAAPLNAIAEGYDKYYNADPDAVNPVTMALSALMSCVSASRSSPIWICSRTLPTSR